MPVSVDIADRLYDYTDEEKAAEAVAEFQSITGLDDDVVVSIWRNLSDTRRDQLEAMIFAAVDLNGSVRRAEESVPGEIYLEVV